MEHGMDGSAARTGEANLVAVIDIDACDQKIRDMHRALDGLRRENRVLKIAVAELERVAERDTLTPLYNRRHFITALHQRIARVARDIDCASLVYIDVNQLKTINERYGHAAGDYALIEIARRLTGAIRAGDIAARIGGDEFGLILDHMTAKDAQGLVVRFAQLLSDVPVMFDGHAIALSACFGIATIAGDMTEADVLAAADRDLCRAKAGQRGTA